MVFLLNSQSQGVSGKNEQSTQTQWRGAQCSCIGCIGLKPALPWNTKKHCFLCVLSHKNICISIWAKHVAQQLTMSLEKQQWISVIA